MLRFVLSKDNMYHVLPQDFCHLSWLTIPKRVQFFKLNQVFKIRLGTAPSYLTDSFQSLKEQHSYRTRRSSYDFFISKELAASPCTFAFTAVKFWNRLPNDLKEIAKFETFKSRLKHYLFSSD